MSALVLLNLLNERGEIDKMRGLLSFLSLFCNKFNKFNNTRAGIIDSIYHITLRLLQNLISVVKMIQFCHVRHNISRKSVSIKHEHFCKNLCFPKFPLKFSGLPIILHGVISLPDAMSYDKIVLEKKQLLKAVINI